MAQWNTLPLGAGGLVTGMHIANDGSMVCRTDVGNIYRWSGLSTDYANPAKQWVPLLTYTSLAGTGPAGGAPDPKGNNIGGWEHVLAPGNSAVHLAIFCDMARNDGLDRLWYSTNSGVTWASAGISFTGSSAASNNKPGAYYKNSNYKIVIDPVNANVAYCGVPISSGNTAGIYTSLNQSGGSTLATWVSVKTSGATPIPAVASTSYTQDGVAQSVSCGLAIDPTGGTSTVGGQTVSSHIILPVGGVGIYESTNGGVSFTEIAVTPFGTANFFVTNGGFTAGGIYYCVVVSTTVWGIWRYASGTWTKINYSGAAQGDFISGSFLIIDPRSGTSNKAYLSFVNANHGVGIGFTSIAASTGSPTWTGANGGQTGNLLAASYDIPWLNYIFGQAAGGASPYSTMACVDPNGVLFWSGNQSLFYFGTSAVSSVPIDVSSVVYPNTGAFTSYSWSMGRGQEATVAQDVLCPPGGTYPVLATQDLGTPMRGTFSTYPADMAVRYVEFTCESLEYAGSDPSFMVARITDQTNALTDVSKYSTNYGADTTWTLPTQTPSALWQATLTGGVSNGSGGSGNILNVTAVGGGGIIFPYAWLSTNSSGSGFQARIQPYGTSSTTGTGGTGTYIVDQLPFFIAAGTSLFSVVPVQGGHTVAVDHDKWMTAPAGLNNIGLGQWVTPAFTTNAMSTATWSLCSGLPRIGWVPRPWSFGPTCKPFAVGYGADAGVAWACAFNGTMATLYRSPAGSFGTFSSIASWTIGGDFVANYCLSVPGFPGELWVSGNWSGSGMGLWHITNANTGAATVTAITLPGSAPITTAFSIGAPASGGGYPTLYLMGGTGFQTTQYIYQGSYPGSGSTVTWSLFGPTGTQQDLPAVSQLAGIIAIRGDMNVYQRLYAVTNQTGFAWYGDVVSPTGPTNTLAFSVIQGSARRSTRMVGYSIGSSYGTASGSTTPALITDAFGLWYFDKYQTTDNNAIVPNQATAVSVFSQQLMRQSRRINNGRNWSVDGSGMAIANNIVDPQVFYTGPTGILDAARLTVTASSGLWRLYQQLRPPLGWSAGSYTLACNVRAQSGNGKFKFVIPFQDNYSAEMTATGSWQRFSQTLSADSGHPYIGIGHNSPAADTVLDICDFNAYAGSSDLGVETFAGHLRIFTGNYGTSGITFDGSSLSCVQNIAGGIQWPSAITFGNITVLCYCKIILPPFNAGYQLWLANATPENDCWMVGTDNAAHGFGIAYGTTSSSQALITGPSWPLTGLDTTAFHVIAATWDGTTGIVYIDGVEQFRSTPTGIATPVVWDMLFNDLASHPGSFAYKSLVLVQRAGSAAEVAAASSYLAAR